MSEKITHPIQHKALFWREGVSLIMPDESGDLRYVYEDGSQDSSSTVDSRTPHMIVDGSQLETLLEERRLKAAAEVAIIGATETEPIMFGLSEPLPQ